MSRVQAGSMKVGGCGHQRLDEEERRGDEKSAPAMSLYGGRGSPWREGLRGRGGSGSFRLGGEGQTAADDAKWDVFARGAEGKRARGLKMSEWRVRERMGTDGEGSAEPKVLTGERGTVYRAAGGAVSVDDISALYHELMGTRVV